MSVPSIDPTENVIALTEAANKRQDDLRKETEKLFDSKFDALGKQIKSQAEHQRELDKAESERLNSIRQVDREEVVKTAAAVVTTAETLRAQVQTTALAQSTQFTAFQAEVNKRLSALELSSSASGAGSAGEKSGRITQQQMIQWIVMLILAGFAIAAYIRK